MATTIARAGFSNWPTYGRAPKWVPLSAFSDKVNQRGSDRKVRSIAIAHLLALLCWRQEKPSGCMAVQSQLGRAPGSSPPQKRSAAQTLHIKHLPTHKGQHWWAHWHLLSRIHVPTVSLYICCQILSRGEKHFPVFIWRPLREACSHDCGVISSRCLARETSIKCTQTH